MLVAVERLGDSRYLVADMDDLADTIEKDVNEILSKREDYFGVSKEGKIRCFKSTKEIVSYDTARRKIAGYQLLYDVDFDEVTLNGCTGRMPKLLKIPEFVTNIEYVDKLIGCMPEESVLVIPKSVRDIVAVQSSFKDQVYSIKRLEVYAQATIVGYVFAGIESLEEVVIGSSVNSLWHNVFFRCYNLRKIIIMNGLRYFGLNSLAFTGVEQLALPSSVVEFHNGWNADDFSLTKLKRVRMSEKLYNKYESDLVVTFSYVRKLGKGYVELRRD